MMKKMKREQEADRAEDDHDDAIDVMLLLR